MTNTANYVAPRITERRDLAGTMMPTYVSEDGSSDAQIKHSVRPVTGYQAPQITQERQLDGRLIYVSEYD